jgi:hypothetical protein
MPPQQRRFGGAQRLLPLAAFVAGLMLLLRLSSTVEVPITTNGDRPSTTAVPPVSRPPLSLPATARGEHPVATASGDDVASFTLPFQYDMHRRLPTRAELLKQTATQLQATCGAPAAAAATKTAWASVEGRHVLHSITGISPAEDAPPTDQDVWKKIAAEFSLTEDFAPQGSPFLSARNTVAGQRDADFDGSLPCTAEIQQRLHEYQHRCAARGGGGADAKFLVSRLKEGAHGVGSAITLLAHDFLAAMILGRTFAIAQSRWYFAPASCASGGWECLYTAPTSCPVPAGETVISSASQGRHAGSVVRKKAFDISGLSRNDAPTLEDFFGSTHAAKCAPLVRRWAESSHQSVYLMGTFAKGADPILGYMMAQVTRYLMRQPQPWFGQVLRHHIKVIFRDADELSTAVYVQDRGEIAKYREYYNAFGCHTFDAAVFVDIPAWLRAGHESPVLYVSGNTPKQLHDKLTAAVPASWRVRSVWTHPAMAAKTSETARWGASLPFSSWVDMYVGVGSGAWVCAVQSNWCRVINFLRMTAEATVSRPRVAECPFIDLGLLMLANTTARRRYCVVGPDWPTKPFSGAAKNVLF